MPQFWVITFCTKLKFYFESIFAHFLFVFNQNWVAYPNVWPRGPELSGYNWVKVCHEVMRTLPYTSLQPLYTHFQHTLIKHNYILLCTCFAKISPLVLSSNRSFSADLLKFGVTGSLEITKILLATPTEDLKVLQFSPQHLSRSLAKADRLSPSISVFPRSPDFQKISRRIFFCSEKTSGDISAIALRYHHWFMFP